MEDGFLWILVLEGDFQHWLKFLSVQTVWFIFRKVAEFIIIIEHVSFFWFYKRLKMDQKSLLPLFGEDYFIILVENLILDLHSLFG